MTEPLPRQDPVLRDALRRCLTYLECPEGWVSAPPDQELEDVTPDKHYD